MKLFQNKSTDCNRLKLSLKMYCLSQGQQVKKGTFFMCFRKHFLE